MYYQTITKYEDNTINAPKGSNVTTCHRNHNEGLDMMMKTNMGKSWMKHNFHKTDNICLILIRKQLPLYNTVFQNAVFYYYTLNFPSAIIDQRLL